MFITLQFPRHMLRVFLLSVLIYETQDFISPFLPLTWELFFKGWQGPQTRTEALTSEIYPSETRGKKSKPAQEEIYTYAYICLCVCVYVCIYLPYRIYPGFIL